MSYHEDAELHAARPERRLAPPAPRRRVGLLGCALALSAVAALAAGCSSTPRQPDDQPVATATELAEQPAPTVDLPEAEAVDTTETQSEDKKPADGTVAPHVNARVRGAIENAERGNVDAAISTLSELVSEDEGGFLAAFNLGVLHERQGEEDIAARRYVQALQKYPDFTPALVNLVRIYLRQNRAKDADEIARRLVEARPDNLEHRAARLEVWLAQKRYEDVIRGAREILRKDERHVDAMLAMAQANYQLERYELGMAILRSALKLAPQRAEIFYLYGNIELAMGNGSTALVNFRRAVELRPAYPEARNNLGLLYHEARDYDAAIEQYTAAIEYFPAFKEAYLNLGNAYKGQARFKEAETAFLRAISVDNEFADAYFNLAILYLESDIPGHETIARLNKAIEVFNQYRSAARGRADNDELVTRYIAEANKAIEQAKARQEMERRAQMQAEGQEEPNTAQPQDPGEDAQGEEP